MAWNFEIKESAERDIARLDKPIQRCAKEKLAWLKESFINIVPEPLGFDLKGFFKLRFGDWRIVYEIIDEKEMLIVHAIDRRDKVYKRKI